MATNPLYNSFDSPNNATQPTKAVNRQGVNVKRTHNTFDNSYFHYKTQRFGQYEPFFVMEGVAGDLIPLHSSHNIRTLPMSSPFLSQLKLNKDYFLVPYQAIMPNTWEYIYRNPSQGDDVPDTANCLFPLYASDSPFIENLWTYIMNANQSLPDKFRVLLILEMFLSQGSLLSQLGYHLNPRIQIVGENPAKYYSFDRWFDGVMRSINTLTISYKSTPYIYHKDINPDGEHYISLYQALSLLRTYGSECSIFDITYDDTIFTKSAYIKDLPKFVDTEDVGVDVNISRLLAYQVSCAQFYVNPQVDFLYNAQLYRDNLYTLWKLWAEEVSLDTSIKTFTYNGITIPFDYASKQYFVNVVSVVTEENNIAPHQLYDYLYSIFGHRESLRFGDYFTDSRTRPLGEGENKIQVNEDGVDVIDVSKSIVFQRFRNAIIKLGNNFGDYLRGIDGTEPSPDYHFPKFIAHQDFDVNGFEVANTSENQGNLVTNLSSREDTFSFEVSVDMPCVILGVSYFSVPRVYMQTKDRHFFHRDRYDMFNPMLQYIGDQAVYNHERTDMRPNDEIFGYQSRNNEYKQRYSVVSGAFATELPAWTFVGDSMFDPLDDIAIANTQSPEYIRAHDYEFNRFFASMVGYSLANAFHFIVVYNNKCMSTRPMEINPNIL